MKFLSVCSGIEAASVAWEPLGWKAAAFAEIEKFPSAVLAHHWPDVPNLGDMTKHHDWPNTLRPDIIVGGTPCQAFSVAGLRKGLEDPRGNLTLVFLGVLEQFRPRWVVWENVPGVLSDKTGAFGAFLGGLGELGYGFAYRVLDAQHFGVPQRRRRVFVVGCLGGWQSAAAVLFEPESLRGDSPPSRETGEGITGTLGARSLRSIGAQDATCGHLMPHWPSEIAPTINAHFGEKQGLENQHIDGGAGMFVPGITHTLRGEGFDASEDGTGRGTPLTVVPTLTSNGDAHSGYRDEHGLIAYTLTFCDANGRRKDRPNGGIYVTEHPEITPTLTGADIGIRVVDPVVTCYGIDEEQNAAVELMGCLKARTAGGGFEAAVAFAQNTRDEVREMEIAGCLAAQPGMKQQTYLRTNTAVRRLTPRECERLQGFPDDHTLIPWRGKRPADCPDGPRYKSLGNSMAVPVMRWIGEGIAAIDRITKEGAK